ncbi:MAG: glycoside hydrolase family 3 protein [Lachnospiraceae bacterium]|nr:glycoside hydrolase family 3 protein [Lachnospiraceae bacterium]
MRLSKHRYLAAPLAACMLLSTAGNGMMALADVENLTETQVEATGTVSGNLEAEGRFYADFATTEDEQKAAQLLHIEMSSEGQVLLKNGDEAPVLPLGEAEKDITLFGVSSVSMSVGGVGSGATRQKSATDPNAPSFDWVSGFASEGFNVNPKTISMYKNYAATQGKVTAGDLLNPGMEYFGKSITSTYASYGDAAVVVLSRIGAENDDLDTNNVKGHSNPDDHYLQLNDNEVELIHHVKDNFGKVIVIINSSNIMQIPELAEAKTEDNLGVDAILWVGGVGNAGTVATARILNGTVNPSGHTVSTWEKDFTKAPYWTNFSENTQNKDENGVRQNAFYLDPDGNQTEYVSVEYREGIYTDYRYYETGYDDMNAAEPGSGDEWYDSQVLYPFGYGLSYTNFEWELAGISADRNIAAANQTITMQVKVTNTGDMAGKDVVELYYTAPYTVGGIEKASANLGAFAKTKLLQPGESDIVTMQLVAQDMASFDWNDANGNGFEGYELEKGTYTISARRNSHEVVLSEEFTIADDILCTTDYVSGNEIKPVFTDEYTTVRDSLLDNMISRATGMVQPKAQSVEDRTLTLDEYFILEASEYYYPYMDEEGQAYYVEEVPESWTQGAESSVTMQDLAGKNYTAPVLEDGVVTVTHDENSDLWEEYMNSLTYDEMFGWLRTGASGANGPIQLSGSTCWQTGPITAATWNQELVAEQGRLFANEAIFKGVKSWYGNGCDIHRSPFSGRNFEYYSADPYLSGVMAAVVVKACTEKGIICMAKHFFANDQEFARNDLGGVVTLATEQTFREISAKPFEMVVKSGNSLSLMTSFNRIGWVTNSCNYAVHQYLLRDEWGFKGFTCTDAWSKDHWSLDLTYRGGDDALMSGSASGTTGWTQGSWDAEARDGLGMVAVPDEDGTGTLLDPTHYYAVRTSAQRILFAYANSNNMKNFIPGVELTADVVYGVNNTALITSDLSTDMSITVPANTEVPNGLSFNGMTVSYAKYDTGEDRQPGDPGYAEGSRADNNIYAYLEEGIYEIPVKVTCDTWVSNVDAVLKVRVVGPLTFGGKNVCMDEPALTVKAGEAIDAEIGSDIYGYYAETPSGRVMHWFQDEEHGAFVQHGDKFECYTYEVKDDTVKHLADFEVVGDLPEGLNAEDIVISFMGKGSSFYDVNSGLKLTGAIATPGTYTIHVKYTVPLVGWFGSGWYRLPGSETVVEQDFVIVVE